MEKLLTTTKKNLIRTFIAIDASDILNETFSAITHVLNHQTPANQIKWSKKENLHLTLCFLGEISQDQVSQLQEKIIDLTQDKKPFALAFGKFSHFPPLSSSPHSLTLYVHLTRELMDLVHSIETAVAHCHLPIEKRPYLPHITLGRLPLRHEIDLAACSLEKLPTQWTIKEFGIYRSDSDETGSYYTLMQKISFAE